MQTSPPKFVPTLTQVVQPSATTPSTAAAAASTTPSFAAASPAKGQLTDALTLQIQQRVLQHVTDHVMRQIQTTLERQIREAVAGVALTHAHAIAQDLEPAIEEVVTSTLAQALHDALAKELKD
jgi:Tfp pilus assembly PilM family ATPase